ncbi:MAG: SdiA-regulated domain-containing protein, partial [Bacteroidales bacterium]
MKYAKTNIIFPFLFLIALFSCKKDDPKNENNLILISQFPINIPETSGLAGFQDDTFLTISDSLSKVYKINSSGEILKSFDYVGENTEGIAYDPMSREIYVVEEKTNEIVQLDTNGFEVNRFSIPLNNQFEKHGLEGISYNPFNHHLYVVSEKLPSILFEVTKDGTIVESHELNFADDYSSVFYDPHQN